LNRLSDATDILKNWPESDGDDSSVHVETTTKLIGSLQKIVAAVKEVEEKAMKGDGSEGDKRLIKALREMQVPLDLLDLMDYGGGLNPDVFARGLLREAVRRLAGLKRRKLALELLSSAVHNGMVRREARKRTAAVAAAAAAAESEKAEIESHEKKRKRENEGFNGDRSGDDGEPPLKR